MTTTTRKAMLWEELSDRQVRCHLCQYRCRIQPGKRGVCGVRENADGELITLVYGQVSSAAVDPIEKKPLFHFHPGSTVFSLGTLGCNFHCVHCQNWEISFADPATTRRDCQYLSPEDAIATARGRGCRGIAWTYNEPTVWFEYTFDSAVLAKQAGLYTAYVTNGYMTAEALDTIGPYLEAYRVDVKGLDGDFYSRIAKVPSPTGILAVAERARDRWGMHVEVVTNVIPTVNDDNEQLRAIARWIREKLGEMTPWHVTRFHPDHRLREIQATPLSTLERAHLIGTEVGLKFVYLGNVPGHSSENTTCYQCGQAVVRRWGYHTELIGLAAGRCASCGAVLGIRE
ncbi:MAG: AmmeMemoRadiSam system radical SAM enzyme [Chloroflexota bacterium]|nr:MAG: AmmeMemoRadiSam system radical SAM enzyme [Chloroflexota bacterium]